MTILQFHVTKSSRRNPIKAGTKKSILAPSSAKHHSAPSVPCIQVGGVDQPPYCCCYHCAPLHHSSSSSSSLTLSALHTNLCPLQFRLHWGHKKQMVKLHCHLPTRTWWGRSLHERTATPLQVHNCTDNSFLAHNIPVEVSPVSTVLTTVTGFSSWTLYKSWAKVIQSTTLGTRNFTWRGRKGKVSTGRNADLTNQNCWLDMISWKWWFSVSPATVLCCQVFDKSWGEQGAV